jgi:hypothetical protein
MNRIRRSGNRGRFAQVMVAGVAVMLGAGSTLMAARTASAVDCTSPTPGAPMFIDDTCTDPRWNTPFIDIDEMRTTPVPHRYVNGGFTGTSARFSFYFPPADQYQGRFIQGPVHPLTLNENLGNTQIAFVIASGGYAVMTNQGGAAEAPITSDGVIIQGKNPEIFYRVNAAAAKYSRQLATAYYGTSARPYGYIHGGSGGAYQSVSCLENTTVWDGGVPFVQGSESAIPTAYTVRIHVQRIIGPTGKFPCVDQAYDAGGSGDPATECNLTEEEAGALEEATRGGFPTRGWFGGALTGAGALPLVAGYVPFLDFAYINDFWTLAGYLGHDDPYGSLATARIQHSTTVVNKLTSPNRLVLATFPTGILTAIDLQVESGTGASTIGQQGFPPGWAQSPPTNAGAMTVTLSGNYTPIYNAVAIGDQVRLDNSLYLALQTYHRHQLGGPVQAYYPWDQFRNPPEPNGTPIYPQRSVITGIVGQHNGSGGNITGQFNGKMIIQQSLMDVDAHPWGADWYKRRAQKFLGNKLDDRFRIYFQDYAQHGGGGGTSPRTVSYNGALQQDLRDLSAWVEQGVKAPASTNYQIENFGQVVVPPTAGQRKGIQPVVTLLANDAARADVAVGEPVTLSGLIQCPPGVGKVVSAEWNVEGTTGGFVSTPFGDTRPSVSIETTHVFTTPGTYFPVLRATSQRQGDPNTPFARVDNIGRVRVVVH